MVMVKVTSPPGSSSLVTDGVLVTAMAGAMSVMVTVASSDAVAWRPSSVAALAVTTSVSTVPPIPPTNAVKEHV